MDRWKSRGGKSQRRQRVRRKKIKVRKKGRKVETRCVFRGSKSSLAKAAGAEPFGAIRDQIFHGVLARSSCWKRTCQTHCSSERLLEVDMWKKCALLCHEAKFEVKTNKTTMFGALFEVEMLKKCTPLWHEAHFEVKTCKAHHSQSMSEHCWKRSCSKSARSCGAKHVLKSKVLTGFKALIWSWDVENARSCGAK